MRITISGACLFSIVTGADNEYAVVDFANDRILHATSEGWRLLGWQTFDEAGRLRLLPAEYFWAAARMGSGNQCDLVEGMEKPTSAP